MPEWPHSRHSRFTFKLEKKCNSPAKNQQRHKRSEHGTCRWKYSLAKTSSFNFFFFSFLASRKQLPCLEDKSTQDLPELEPWESPCAGAQPWAPSAPGGFSVPGNSLPKRFRAGSQHWEMKGEDESVTRTVTANRRKKKTPCVKPHCGICLLLHVLLAVITGC